MERINAADRLSDSSRLRISARVRLKSAVSDPLKNAEHPNNSASAISS